jgi:serine phosphatase RsbU (regulator of sigma subunit)
MVLRNINHILILFLVYTTLASSQESFIISSNSFEDVISIEIRGDWKYSQNYNLEWADKDYNDSLWENADPHIYPESKIAKEWQEIGWFRVAFKIDSSLHNKTFRVAFYSAGNIQFYYNGKLTHLQDTDREQNYDNLQFVTITFSNENRQVFAVRFSNRNTEKFNDAGIMAGFAVFFGPVDKYNAASLDYNVRIISYQMFFLGLTLAFGLLHLRLFIYYREAISNLYFAIFLLLYAISTYYDYAHSIYSTVSNFLVDIRLHRFFVALTLIASVRLILSIFCKRLRIPFWIFVTSVIVASIFVYMKPTENFKYLEIINFFGVALILYIFVTAMKERQQYVWLIATGFLFVFTFSLYDFFLDVGLINPVYNITNGYPFGLVGLFVCISIYLAKDIANRNRVILEQESVVKEKQLQEKILQKENDQKKYELEEARKIQLSMLPECLNNFPDYDICFDMRTATEVGGDYYDYSLGGNGTLNIVIGDATGHGVKAGLMVATFKSLFNALGNDLEVTEFLKRSNDIVRNMKLGNLFMSMSFVRLTKGQFVLTNAGMPPCLHYRKKTGDIERIIIKSMPLGSPLGISYRTEKRKLESGDIILLLSDGLEELFNEKMEMLGLEKILETILQNTKSSANKIAARLFSIGDEWRSVKQQHDDITVAVIKVK